MGYYGKRRFRSWQSYGSYAPPTYSALANLFGSAVGEIREAFENLGGDAIDELFSDYGAIHGDSAESYARKTFPSWQSGKIKLSGQTMQRLVELVPPYLSPEKRFSLLQSVLRCHKKTGGSRTIKINIKEPNQGFTELQNALASMPHNDMLSHLPKKVMKAASWLYDDDITAARAMLAEAERLENDMIRSSAAREIELLRRTISSGQVKSASYTVEMPAGKLNVVAYSPSMCFVATVCFGQSAPETAILRAWRDQYLIEQGWGRLFIVWYYNNGEKIADLTSRSPALKGLAKACLRIFIKAMAHKSNGGVI